jgi:hypothetical protein
MFGINIGLHTNLLMVLDFLKKLSYQLGPNINWVQGYFLVVCARYMYHNIFSRSTSHCRIIVLF